MKVRDILALASLRETAPSPAGTGTEAPSPRRTTRLASPPEFHIDARDDFEVQAQLDSWLCPHCGHPAMIENVFPSLDGERTLTMWSCEACQVVAVTPNAIKEPPTGWVSRVKQ